MTATAAAALAIGLAASAGASAGLVDDLLNQVNDTVNQVRDGLGGITGQGGGGSDGAAPAPAAGPQPSPQAATTEPAPDGTNPHGQGTVLDIQADLLTTLGTDDVVVGRSRGEQDDAGDYHGSVTIVSALGLDVAVSTDEGESQSSPLAGVNDLLDEVCMGSGNNVCLNVVEFESTTTDSGSANSFSAADANVGDGLVTARLLQSGGFIEDDGECQTADGFASTADAEAAGIGLTALESASSSRSCRDGTKEAGGESEVLSLNGGELGLLCDGTTVDEEFDLVVVAGVCNGDSTDTSVPFNVRKALQVEVLGILLQPLGLGNLQVNAGSAESLARAPDAPEPVCPDPTNPDCPEPPEPEPECPDPDNPACPEDRVADREGAGKRGGPPAAGGPSAAAPGASLPFTGADAIVMALIGGGVLGLGLLGMALADRQRKARP